MLVKKEKIARDLIILKKVWEVYQKVDEEKRGKLLVACEPIIERLVGEGVDRAFVESLIVSGKDFVDSLFEGDEEVVFRSSDPHNSNYNAEIIFS